MGKNARPPCTAIVNSSIIAKFSTGIADQKYTAQAKQNSEISTDVIDNDVIMLRIEHFIEKHSSSTL